MCRDDPEPICHVTEAVSMMIEQGALHLLLWLCFLSQLITKMMSTRLLLMQDYKTVHQQCFEEEDNLRCSGMR